jgi:hypothetical protein
MTDKKGRPHISGPSGAEAKNPDLGVTDVAPFFI